MISSGISCIEWGTLSVGWGGNVLHDNKTKDDGTIKGIWCGKYTYTPGVSGSTQSLGHFCLEVTRGMTVRAAGFTLPWWWTRQRSFENGWIYTSVIWMLCENPASSKISNKKISALVATILVDSSVQCNIWIGCSPSWELWYNKYGSVVIHTDGPIQNGTGFVHWKDERFWDKKWILPQTKASVLSGIQSNGWIHDTSATGWQMEEVFDNDKPEEEDKEDDDEEENEDDDDEEDNEDDDEEEDNEEEESDKLGDEDDKGNDDDDGQEEEEIFRDLCGFKEEEWKVIDTFRELGIFKEDEEELKVTDEFCTEECVWKEELWRTCVDRILLCIQKKKQIVEVSGVSGDIITVF